MEISSKILIVSANRLTEPYPVYPLGVSYLASYLERHLAGYRIDLFDFNLGSIEEFSARLAAENYRYVCVSLRNIDDVNIFKQESFLEWYRTIVEAVRGASTATVVVGGSGFSIFPRAVMEYIKPDYGICSEGEQALVELIEKLDSGQDASRIEGLVLQGQANQRTHYLQSISLELNEQLAKHYWQQGGMIGLQTKRGCPLSCIYCSYPLIEGRKVRTLDVEQVVENIERAVESGIDFIFFTDSIFNIDRRYNRRLAERIIERRVKFNWAAYFAPYNLDYDELALYQQAGLSHIEFGTESFSDTQLKNYGKPFRFDDVERISRYCYDLNIFYAHFLILGGYGETPETLAEGFERAKRIEHSVFFPYLGMRIYPGTELCRIAVAKGVIQSEEELLAPTYYVEPGIELDQIKEMAAKSAGKWIFSDQEPSPIMEKLRQRGVKGPLWEYLRY